MAIDQAKLDRFLERFVADLGAVLAAPNVVLGDRLGLYKALAAIGPATPAELAGRTGTHERYVTEWLRGQAAGGYVSYDPTADRYLLGEEQAFALADETSPAFVAGAFQLATSTIIDEPKVAEAFRTGEGVGWDQHHPGLFEGTERFFRPGYVANLVDSWIPSLDGVQAKLDAGARVADVGCGHGASTILMAAAWPRSSFAGFDYHRPSIERARKAAADAGGRRRLPLSATAPTMAPAREEDGHGHLGRGDGGGPRARREGPGVVRRAPPQDHGHAAQGRLAADQRDRGVVRRRRPVARRDVQVHEGPRSAPRPAPCPPQRDRRPSRRPHSVRRRRQDRGPRRGDHRPGAQGRRRGGVRWRRAAGAVPPVPRRRDRGGAHPGRRPTRPPGHRALARGRGLRRMQRR